MATATKCGREHGSVPSCAICEVLEHAQEQAFAKDQCGSLSHGYPILVCDRETGHKGNHRGYYVPADEVLFWKR